MAIDRVGWDWSYMANEGEDHALVADKEALTEFALMANTESKVFDNSLCSKDCKKNNDSLNCKITDLTDQLFDANNYIYHYKLAVAQLEGRLVEYKEREVKYIKKIRTLEFYRESNKECIESLSKQLETLKLEKDEVDGKLAGLLKASKYLNNQIESQRSDKNKDKTSLPEFADDTVTDYSRPSPTVESTSEEGQNKNYSTFEDVTSPITTKPFVKFVKPKDCQSKSKPNKKETPKKSPVKYAEIYRKSNKKPNVRGNQRNWNNLKSYQLGTEFVLKKKACFNCGDFTHLANDCGKRVKRGTTRKNFPAANRKFPTASKKFPTDSIKIHTADMGRKGKAGSSQNNIDDKGYWDSSCSRHMTGNISYLSDFEPFDGGYVSFGQGGCKITGKGTIKTDKLEFENVYFVKDLKYNLFSVSQICDNKNSVLFTDSKCIVLGRDFILLDDANIFPRTPMQHNMYSIDLNNIVPHRDLTCLVAKASANECTLWHRRLGYLNVKIMNKLVRNNLVRGLPTKSFDNDHTCIACLKGKQHKASCKSKLVNSVTKPLHTLHMDLFGLTFVSSISHKWYCLVVTDDFSRFTWTFFLRTKDETSGILKKFITEIEYLKDLKVKIIRCDNGGEFRNKEMNDFCSQKEIKREFSNARTPQQNSVAERRNKTLIEAARTMVLVNKSQNKTPYELFNGRTPAIGFLKPFGCHVMILNTLDHFGKFEEKGDEGYFIRYSMSSKAFRVFNKRTRRLEENLHIEFLENKAIEKGAGPNWLFDIDSLTKSMNYVLVDACTNSTNLLGTKDAANQEVKKDVSSLRYIALPNWVLDALLESSSNEAIGVEADVNNMETTITASPTPTLRIHKDHPKSQIIGPVDTLIQTRLKSKEARLVAQGHTQKEGIDYDEVFTPVPRIEAIRLFLAYASFMGFIVYQMDVKSAFLYGTIHEEVYVMQPSGFQDLEFLAKVYNVENAIEFEALMHKKFQMSAMGELNFFLSLQVLQKKDGIFLSQDKYVGDILKKFGYTDVRSSNTPMDKENPWGKDRTGKDVDSHLYRSMIGSLMYLTVSRPDIMFAACACAKHQVTPKEYHLHAVKRIFRYLKGHPKLGLWYPKESHFDLVVYSDSDYGGATQDRKSTTGGSQFLGRRLISWQCKKQTTIATSTTEAEYVIAASCCG
nr:hypothetical protein [Tanacetum cinerariifolium]